MSSSSPHLSPLFLDFTSEGRYALFSAFSLSDAAGFCTSVHSDPLSSHRSLITDVFKHWTMSSTWRWLDTPSRVSFHVASLVVSLRQPGCYKQQQSGPSSAATGATAADAAAGRPTGLLLLLRLQSTNFMRSLDIDSCSLPDSRTTGVDPNVGQMRSTSAQVVLLADELVCCCCCARC